MNVEIRPIDLDERIGYGLYNGVEQFYIEGVDGTLAELGTKRPSNARLLALVAAADIQHAALIARHNRETK